MKYLQKMEIRTLKQDLGRFAQTCFRILILFLQSKFSISVYRDWFPKFENWQNIKIGIVQKIQEWPSCSFAKMILQLWGHFDKKTPWSLIYILYEQCLFWYLAHSQILGISLYDEDLHRIYFVPTIQLIMNIIVTPVSES